MTFAGRNLTLDAQSQQESHVKWIGLCIEPNAKSLKFFNPQSQPKMPSDTETEAKIEAEKERLGLDAADDRAGAGLDAYQEAVGAVYETVPRSKEGLLALIGVFLEDHKGIMPEEDTVETVLASIAASVKEGVANV
jgi:hypothetical protein